MILGIDVGGTHTDAVCIENGTVVATAKALTSHDLVASIREVITGLGVDPGKVRRTILSTTLSTNAIIEKTFPRAGMIISAGPGIDPGSYFLNDDFYLVSGAMDHRGREYIPLKREEVLEAAGKLKSSGIEGVGIVSKFSVRNPGHEMSIHSLINKDFEHISLGHTLSGSLNFPRRVNTAYFNTAVMPMQKGFVQSVKKALSLLPPILKEVFLGLCYP